MSNLAVRDKIIGLTLNAQGMIGVIAQHTEFTNHNCYNFRHNKKVLITIRLIIVWKLGSSSSNFHLGKLILLKKITMKRGMT